VPRCSPSDHHRRRRRRRHSARGAERRRTGSREFGRSSICSCVAFISFFIIELAAAAASRLTAATHDLAGALVNLMACIPAASGPQQIIGSRRRRPSADGSQPGSHQTVIVCAEPVARDVGGHQAGAVGNRVNTGGARQFARRRSASPPTISPDGAKVSPPPPQAERLKCTTQHAASGSRRRRLARSRPPRFKIQDDMSDKLAASGPPRCPSGAA
jgi:hypothetical protein